MLYQVFTVREYFSNKFKQLLAKSDIKTKIDLLSAHKPEITVLDLCGGLKSQTQLMKLNFTYYGIYDVQKCTKFIQNILKKGGYIILLLDKESCLSCTELNENIIKIYET